MSVAFQKFLEDALKDFVSSLRKQGQHSEDTIRNIYQKGADGFVTFLTTGKPPKREQRKRKG